MDAEIKVAFLLEGSKEDIEKASELLLLQQSRTRLNFPDASIAKPYWETVATSYCSETEPVIQVIEDRIRPFEFTIKKICEQYTIEPILLLTVTASYENRPMISISRKQAAFFSALGTTFVINLDGLYPEA